MPKEPERIQTSFKAGMFLLETLTAGMYNDPLSIYREYIQNSVDSIDMAGNNNDEIMTIKINLDPFERCIHFSDNGLGIPSNDAEAVLSSIGSSNKANKGLRGFRGIGRLGGIAFSDKAIFRTKTKDETVESIQEWDCKKLRHYLADTKKSNMPIDQVFNEITTFYSENSKKSADSYFKVTLEGVTSFRNYIFDINKIKKYLSQISPAPFNTDEFSYGDMIDKLLSENLSSYRSYQIILNGEPIYKPYKDFIKTTNKGLDSVERIIPINIDINGKKIAYGWYGKRRDLLGAIAKGDYSSGIRVRVGNILIGDSHLLDGCFREPRFNSYVIGEIHVDTPELKPNSRRDDFVDTIMKTQFYNAIERKIGIDISKEIRNKSRLNSRTDQVPLKSKVNNKTESPDKNTLEEIKEVKSEQCVLTKNQANNSPEIQKLINEIKVTCGECENFSKISAIIEKYN